MVVGTTALLMPTPDTAGTAGTVSFCVTIGTATIGRTTSTYDPCTVVHMEVSPWPTLPGVMVGLAAVTDVAEMHGTNSQMHLLPAVSGKDQSSISL
jgi:hypothetical protein